MIEHVSFTPSGTDATHQENDQPDQASSGWMWSDFTGLTNNGAGTFINGYSDGKAVFRPSNDNWNSNQGVGQIYSNSQSGATTARVFIRGGRWGEGTTSTGIYGLNVLNVASDGAASAELGFRCAR